MLKEKNTVLVGTATADSATPGTALAPAKQALQCSSTSQFSSCLSAGVGLTGQQSCSLPGVTSCPCSAGTFCSCVISQATTAGDSGAAISRTRTRESQFMPSVYFFLSHQPSKASERPGQKAMITTAISRNIKNGRVDIYSSTTGRSKR